MSRGICMKNAATLLVLLTLTAARCAVADPPAITLLRYSADTGANIVDANTFAGRKDFVADDLAGTRARVQIAGLPDTVNLSDFYVEPNGNILFALDIGATLGGIHFSGSDVIRFSGSSFSKEFDAASAGVPAGVHCDGVARLGDTGKLLLSFDRTFTVGNVTIRPADVILYSGNSFGTKILDARAQGLSDTLNVDAVDSFRTKDYLLVSFDTAGAIAGITFTPADVLQLHLTDGTWSKRFAVSTFSNRWDRANLDGVDAVNNDTIFQDDFQ